MLEVVDCKEWFSLSLSISLLFFLLVFTSVFFLFEQNFLYSPAHACMCVRFAFFFVSPLRWLTKCNRCVCVAFCAVFSRRSFFLLLLLDYYSYTRAQVKRTTNGSFFFFFFFSFSLHTNSADSFTNTNIHLICARQIFFLLLLLTAICPNVYKKNVD